MRKELLLAAMGISSLTPGCVKIGIGELLDIVADEPMFGGAEDVTVMCYEVATPPERTEYVCLTCGKKTIHALKAGEWFDAPYLCVQQYRTLVHKLNLLGLNVKLDESFLCSACKKDGASTFFIDVVYKNRKSRRALSGMSDLQKLVAYFEGKSVWIDDNGREHPLKPELPRICQLLGLEK